MNSFNHSSNQKSHSQFNNPSEYPDNKPSSPAVHISSSHKHKNQFFSKSKNKNSIPSSNKSKKCVPKINIIINNPITSFGTIMDDRASQNPKEEDVESTFVYTGGEMINLNENHILDQLLISPKSEKIEEKTENKKEEKEEKFSKKIEKKKWNNKFDFSKVKGFLERMIKKMKGNFGGEKYMGKVEVWLLVLINAAFYMYLIIKIFGPSIMNILKDLENHDFVYIIHKISEDTEITLIENN